jgi:hypothetical protein
MSLPSQTTVQNLSYVYKHPAWYPAGKLDQFVRKIPFEHVDQPSESMDWNRATALPTVVAFVPGGALPATAMDTTKVTANWLRVGDVAEVDYFHKVAASDPFDQLEVQVTAKKVGVVRALGLGIVEGGGGAGIFEGFKFRITGGQTTGAADNAANGGVPTLNDLHRLFYLVTASDGCVGAGADCFVAAPKAVRFIAKLIEDKGGTPQYVFDPNLGVPVLYFNGIPVYAGQNVSNETKGTGTNLTSVWAVKLTGPTGVRVLHSGGDPSMFGIDVTDIPAQPTVSKIGKFVGGSYALLVPEDESLARLNGCDLTAFV